MWVFFYRQIGICVSAVSRESKKNRELSLAIMIDQADGICPLDRFALKLSFYSHFQTEKIKSNAHDLPHCLPDYTSYFILFPIISQ